jgi:prepilin-type processing-associated H-X9-DG protein
MNWGTNRSRGWSITDLKPPGDVPIYLDCIAPEANSISNYGPPGGPIYLNPPPPDLNGTAKWAGLNGHYRFLIARHGRAINVCMADGSARRVLLEETFQLRWHGTWMAGRIANLPRR